MMSRVSGCRDSACEGEGSACRRKMKEKVMTPSCVARILERDGREGDEDEEEGRA